MSVVKLYQYSAKEAYKRHCSDLESNHLFWDGGSIILLWGDEKDQMNNRRQMLEIGGFYFLWGLPSEGLTFWGRGVIPFSSPFSDSWSILSFFFFTCKNSFFTGGFYLWGVCTFLITFSDSWSILSFFFFLFPFSSMAHIWYFCHNNILMLTI